MATLNEDMLGHPLGPTNPELHITLQALVDEDTPARRADFYQALLRSVLILPSDAPISETTEQRTLTADSQLKLVAFQNQDGGIVIPAFTDEDSVLAWRPEGTPYVALRAPDFLALIARHPTAEVILNLAGPVRGYLTRAELEALAQSQMPQPEAVVKTSKLAVGQVLVTAPEAPLDTLLHAALQQTLARYPEITAAYYFTLKGGQGESRDIIGVRFAQPLLDDARQTLMKSLLFDLGQAAAGQAAMEFIILEDPAFIQTVRDTVEPLYRRPSA